MKIKSQIAKCMKIKQTGDEDIKTDNYLEYKILVLGEKMVGKSSICTRFAMNEFNLEIKPSTQCECYPKTVKLFEEGLISKREYNILSELNKENFMPYFMGIL